ncbi:cellulase family glycosylhydrolase [Coprococcus eutactus]|jgi:endoglucanase|uniref:cellulase family glycosylhydrolase n=1 Tax=Clostridia TaxID=186801 RepID=UPI000E46BD5E|nr:MULTISPECIES: cellulase family glycosylhydrolase [Clostridia]MCB5503775.1 cellulase family glycosylhydrolase [Coprococcus eutactus]NSC95598.1 cellulase family glycosylhydrolase [Coprococcus eutactus]NSD34670.1 cellulase family glycosylhydrolase [Coprococcus eutactus]RGG78553.1 endoglucanase [Clostridium sp. AF17-21AC]RHR59126.1 endoglucanase [Clostridium sp. AF17-2]
MNQKKKTIVLWGVIIVLAAAVVALSVILVTKSRKNNDPDGQKNAGTEAVIEGSGQDAEQKAEDGADQKKEKGASDTQKSTDDKKTLYAEVTVGSTWENNGMTAATETVTIYNKTDKAATDWSVDLEFSGKVTIDQLWNGKYTADESVVHVTAESYNEEIPAGGSIDFGYNLSASDVKPVRCTLMIAGKEVTTVTGDDQQKNDENAEVKTNTGEKAAQTDGQSVDSDKKDQSGSNKVTDTKNGKKEDNPYKAHGKLAVSGTDLVDASGSKFQLKGVSTHGLTWFADFVSKDTYQYFKDSFGINLVRFAMYTDTGDSYGYCSGGNKSEIEELLGKGVDAATDLGLYVIIDWHILNDNDPNMHIDDAKDFFDRISKKYASYGNVIYEIANEPNGGTTWDSVKSYAETIIPIIRKNAPDAIIIVGTPTWSQDVDVAAADPITDQTNLMYAVHFYAATHKDDLRNKVQSALDSGLPIFVSEFGLCDASGNGSIDYDQSDAWFDLINDKNLSYAAWNISNKAETSSLFDSSCTKTSGFTDDDLSDSGRYIKEKIESFY